jgi:ABC-type Fe3+/spermidine/putrescine transport system ATPase subunit
VSNLMEGAAHGQGIGGCRVTLGEFELVAGEGESDTQGASKITIRPERVDLEATGTTGENRVPGMVERVVYVGSILQVFVTLAPGQRIQAWIQNDGGVVPFASGAPVAVHMPREALRVLPDIGTPVSLTSDLEDAEAS